MDDTVRSNLIASVKELKDIALECGSLGAACVLATLTAALCEGSENELAKVTTEYSAAMIERLTAQRK